MDQFTYGNRLFCMEKILFVSVKKKLKVENIHHAEKRDPRQWEYLSHILLLQISKSMISRVSQTKRIPLLTAVVNNFTSDLMLPQKGSGDTISTCLAGLLWEVVPSMNFSSIRIHGYSSLQVFSCSWCPVKDSSILRDDVACFPVLKSHCGKENYWKSWGFLLFSKSATNLGRIPQVFLEIRDGARLEGPKLKDTQLSSFQFMSFFLLFPKTTITFSFPLSKNISSSFKVHLSATKPMTISQVALICFSPSLLGPPETSALLLYSLIS